MNIHKSGELVIWCESVGFLALIALSWLEEYCGLSQLVFGGPVHQGDWRDATIQTLLILVVWGVVFLFTRRLLERLHHLEGFLRICAWCRRIDYRGNWIRMEDFFSKGFQVETTHGMCPECFKRMEHDTAEFKKKETTAATRPPSPSSL